MLNPYTVGMYRPLKHHDDLTPPAIACDLRVATDDVADAPDHLYIARDQPTTVIHLPMNDISRVLVLLSLKEEVSPLPI